VESLLRTLIFCPTLAVKDDGEKLKLEIVISAVVTTLPVDWIIAVFAGLKYIQAKKPATTITAAIMIFLFIFSHLFCMVVTIITTIAVIWLKMRKGKSLKPMF
jgi:hypothetical protein